jgi:hypothetical protein
MRQVFLRLRFVGSLPTREIARGLGVAQSTVRETLKRFAVAGLVRPLPEDMTDEVLEAKLFGNGETKRSRRRHAEPDWAGIHRELKRLCGVRWRRHTSGSFDRTASVPRHLRAWAGVFENRNGWQASHRGSVSLVHRIEDASLAAVLVSR